MKTWIWGVLACAWTVSVDDARVVSWTRERVRAWQPLPEEKSFDKIGWAKDIRDAVRLAKQHNRPVFLFTHTGRINTGRC